MRGVDAMHEVLAREARQAQMLETLGDALITTDGSGNLVPFMAYTSDPKLGTYSTVTTELQIKWRMTVLSHLGPVGERLSRSVVELSGGMWFAQNAVGNQFGIPLVSNDAVGVAGCTALCGAGFAHLGLYVPL